MHSDIAFILLVYLLLDARRIQLKRRRAEASRSMPRSSAARNLKVSAIVNLRLVDQAENDVDLCCNFNNELYSGAKIKYQFELLKLTF